MSEDHFHVHGAHDHHLEHAAEHGAEDKFSGRIAVTTAVLATIGALMSYQGGATQTEAATLKNDAAITRQAITNISRWRRGDGQSIRSELNGRMAGLPG